MPLLTEILRNKSEHDQGILEKFPEVPIGLYTYKFSRNSKTKWYHNRQVLKSEKRSSEHMLSEGQGLNSEEKIMHIYLSIS